MIGNIPLSFIIYQEFRMARYPPPPPPYLSSTLNHLYIDINAAHIINWRCANNSHAPHAGILSVRKLISSRGVCQLVWPVFRPAVCDSKTPTFTYQRKYMI